MSYPLKYGEQETFLLLCSSLRTGQATLMAYKTVYVFNHCFFILPTFPLSTAAFRVSLLPENVEYPTNHRLHPSRNHEVEAVPTLQTSQVMGQAHCKVEVPVAATER